MLYEAINFQSTVVKLYYIEEITPEVNTSEALLPESEALLPELEAPLPELSLKQGREYLKDSQNKVHTFKICIFLSSKEQSNLELSIKLQQEDVITESGALFQASDKKKINALIVRGVFAFKQFNKEHYKGKQIFKSRIVREVKGKITVLYKKSRLVIQIYKNAEKEVILI
jgi:hypothetical protein